MSPPIVLDPSDDTDAFETAVLTAIASGNELRLRPGAHLTKGGKNRRVQVGPGGLRIVADLGAEGERPVIRRPAGQIDVEHADGHFGLYLVPARPQDDELDGVLWHTSPEGDFEFAVLVRGILEVTGIDLDANMHQQGLAPGADAEHSAVLAFSGHLYDDFDPSPEGRQRRAYVAFERVSLDDIVVHNGDHADDIWFGRGYFNPNIRTVELSRIRTAEPANRSRDTISFSEPCARISIRDCDVDSIHMEDAQHTPWSSRPRAATEFHPAFVHLSDITARHLTLTAKGHVCLVLGERLEVSEKFSLNQVDGHYRDCRLTVAIGQDARMIELKEATFSNVEWVLPVDDDGVVTGIRLVARGGQTLRMDLLGCTFTVASDAASGQLVLAKRTSEPGNRIELRALACHYPPVFGTPALPDTRLFFARERGDWTFTGADFGDRDVAQAVQTAPDVHILIL